MNRLSHRFAMFAACVAIVMVVVYSAIAYFVSRDQIAAAAERSILTDSASMTSRIEARLNTIGATLGSLSKNALLYSALVDSAGREIYLQPFLSGFSSVDGIPVEMGLLDFEGKVLAKNRPLLRTETERAWVAQMIAESRSGATVLRIGGNLMVAVVGMLVYPRTESVEGVLYSAFRLSALDPSAGRPDVPGDSRSLLPVTGAAPPRTAASSVLREGMELVVRRAVTIPKTLQGLRLATEFRRETSDIEAALTGQISKYALGGLAVLAFVTAVSFWFGRVLVAPLAELEQVATSIIEKGTFETRLHAEGSEEINRLRIAFNAMLDYLARAYGELHATASGLQAVIRAIPDRLIVLNSSARPMASSPIQIAMQDALSDKPDESFPLPSLKDLNGQLDAVKEGDQVRIVDYAAAPDGEANGEECFYEARLTRIPGGETGPESILMLVRETTNEKRAEDRLRQAQKMEAVGQLTGGIAHDFNNLLSVVIGNMELLALDDTLESHKSASVNKAIEAAQRGAALTARLLAFARRQSLLPEIVSMNELVEGMLEILRRTLGENVTVAFVPGNDIWSCRVDPSQLENALLNLAINGRDAMPQGGRLTVQTANVSFDEAPDTQGDLEPGEYVALTVSDTGTGMSREVLDKVFEPFFTTKETGRGSGLGLSMVYGFVRQSGGSVKIVSEPGVGTTVQIYLPREREAPRVANAPEEATEDDAAASGTILVVDDNDDVLELALRLLDSLGYRTLAARDAGEALAALDANPDISMIFSDVVLPGDMNGFDLVRAALKKRPALRVLMASGFTYVDQLPEDIAARDIRVITKPYRRAELARQVAAIQG